MSTPSRVVVGLMAGEVSPLVWAFAEAGRRSTDLDVVHAWTLPREVSATGIPGWALDAAPFEAHAKQLLDDAIEAVPMDRRSAAVFRV